MQLQAYENQKRRAKKAAADDKVERLRTGGGTFVPQVSINDEKLLAILGKSAKPLVNVFDSDAAYHDYPGNRCFKIKIHIKTNILSKFNYSCYPSKAERNVCLVFDNITCSVLMFRNGTWKRNIAMAPPPRWRRTISRVSFDQ